MAPAGFEATTVGYEFAAESAKLKAGLRLYLGCILPPRKPFFRPNGPFRYAAHADRAIGPHVAKERQYGGHPLNKRNPTSSSAISFGAT